MYTDLHPQDDLLIAVALCEFSVHHEDVEFGLSERAWMIAAELCEMHGLEPSEAVWQLVNFR